MVRKWNAEKIYRKFGHEKRKFLLELYENRPVLYLSEAKELFRKQFDVSISISSIHTILHEDWKVIERRARQIQTKDVLRFCDELSEIPWRWEQLILFCDYFMHLLAKDFGFIL